MAFADKGIGKMLKAIGTSLNPADMLGALAMGINSHEEFRKMLQVVEPEKRKIAYEVMRPRLSFKAHPLDVYIAQAGQEAEAKRLPTWDETTRTTTEFVPARNASTDAEEFMPFARMTCYKCTKTEDFHAETVVGARILAVKAGWFIDLPGERWICPKCPAPRGN